jgi:hypothetical protein
VICHFPRHGLASLFWQREYSSFWTFALFGSPLVWATKPHRERQTLPTVKGRQPARYHHLERPNCRRRQTLALAYTVPRSRGSFAPARRPVRSMSHKGHLKHPGVSGYTLLLIMAPGASQNLSHPARRRICRTRRVAEFVASRIAPERHQNGFVMPPQRSDCVFCRCRKLGDATLAERHRIDQRRCDEK